MNKKKMDAIIDNGVEYLQEENGASGPMLRANVKAIVQDAVVAAEEEARIAARDFAESIGTTQK